MHSPEPENEKQYPTHEKQVRRERLQEQAQENAGPDHLMPTSNEADRQKGSTRTPHSAIDPQAQGNIGGRNPGQSNLPTGDRDGVPRDRPDARSYPMTSRDPEHKQGEK